MNRIKSLMGSGVSQKTRRTKTAPGSLRPNQNGQAPGAEAPSLNRIVTTRLAGIYSGKVTEAGQIFRSVGITHCPLCAVYVGSIDEKRHSIARELYSLVYWLCEESGKVKLPASHSERTGYETQKAAYRRKVDMVASLFTEEVLMHFPNLREIPGAFVVDEEWELYLKVDPSILVLMDL